MSPHKLGIKVAPFDKDDYCNDNLDIVVRRRSTLDLWGESLYNKTGIQIMVWQPLVQKRPIASVKIYF